ncbi:MAG: glycosyltransferase [bacterium]|nr:glycosyltransferase [bacterium]
MFVVATSGLCVTELVLILIFWLSVGLMLHTYVLYPLTLKILPTRFKSPPIDESYLPSIAVLVPAYNEGTVIAEKIRNSLGLSYPNDKIEILIGSDGSTDETDQIVRDFTEARVRLIRFEGRNGKPSILNSLVSQTQADILVLTDANVMITSNDLRQFVRHFQDESVAAVGAAKEIAIRGSADAVGKGEHTYHRRMTDIKRREAEVGGFSGLTGAAYAMLRRDWQPLPLVAMNDDIVSLYPAILLGKRVAYEPAVVAIENSGETVSEEFHRRIRIGVSNFRTLSLCRKLLSPSRPIIAYTFFSNKVIHWFFPLLMLSALATNAIIAINSEIYRALLSMQLLGYGVAALGGLGALVGIRLPFFYQLFSFVAIMFAFLIGGVKFIQGSASSVWERSAR